MTKGLSRYTYSLDRAEKNLFSRRNFLRLGTGIFAVGTGTSAYLVREYNWAQQAKRKMPFSSYFNFQHQYDLPNTSVRRALGRLERPHAAQMPDKRNSLEEKVAELLVVGAANSRDNSKGQYLPGGYLLGVRETRRGNIFGKYSSYDPLRTQNNAAAILKKAEQAEQRVLIYDEGEGGYVPRTGVLPAAEDIGNYYFDNIIEGTLSGKVESYSDKTGRAAEVRRLFKEYAQELSARGIDAVFGPGLDIVFSKDKHNLIYKDGRSFGSALEPVVAIAQLYIEEMHREGIRVVGKHYLGAGLPLNGNVHEEEVLQTRKITPRVLQANAYRQLKHILDGVMVTHIGNPSDKGMPYSVSRRSIECLTQPIYAQTLRGIDFNGTVFVDDLSMEGLLQYVDRKKLTSREGAICAGCDSREAKAAVLALDAGAHALIAVEADADAIVRGIVHAYRIDDDFKIKVRSAVEKYNQFANQFANRSTGVSK